MSLSGGLLLPECHNTELTQNVGADAAGTAAARACARSLAAIFRMRAASMPAPKPLSMLTTDTPGEDEVRAASSGVIPCIICGHLRQGTQALIHGHRHHTQNFAGSDIASNLSGEARALPAHERQPLRPKRRRKP